MHRPAIAGDKRTQRRSVSCQGPTSGRSLVQAPGLGGAIFADRCWAQAFRWRLLAGVAAHQPIGEVEEFLESRQRIILPEGLCAMHRLVAEILD